LKLNLDIDSVKNTFDNLLEYQDPNKTDFELSHPISSQDKIKLKKCTMTDINDKEKKIQFFYNNKLDAERPDEFL
jgi:hypothetical protein